MCVGVCVFGGQRQAWNKGEKEAKSSLLVFTLHLNHGLVLIIQRMRQVGVTYSSAIFHYVFHSQENLQVWMAFYSLSSVSCLHAASKQAGRPALSLHEEKSQTQRLLHRGGAEWSTVWLHYCFRNAYQGREHMEQGLMGLFLSTQGESYLDDKQRGKPSTEKWVRSRMALPVL